MSETNGSSDVYVPPSKPDPIYDPRRAAYRLVAELIERHIREYGSIAPEVRVQLERIEAAMRGASSVDPK